MNYRRNRYGFLLNSINDAVTVNKSFPDALIVEFWNYATGERKPSQVPGRFDDICDDC